MWAHLTVYQKLAGIFFILGKLQGIISITLIFSVAGIIALTSVGLGALFIALSITFAIIDFQKKKAAKNSVTQKIENLEAQLAQLKELQMEY